MSSRRFYVPFLCVLLLACVAESGDIDSKPRATARDENFIVTAPNETLARAVLKRAVALRGEIAREWIGQEFPPSVGFTVIHVYVSKDEERARTMPTTGSKDPSNMMWLTATEEKVQGSLLAHELTHAVICTRYPAKFPPWANEGIASMRDDDQSKKIRRDILSWYVQTGNWPDLGAVLAANQILSRDQAAYAQSSSLVQFFLTHGTRQQLLDFAVDGAARGWGAALERHYGIAHINGLQRDWQAFVSASLAKKEIAAARR